MNGNLQPILSRSLFLLWLFVALLSSTAASDAQIGQGDDDNPEVLFRKSSHAWHTSKHQEYQPWIDLSVKILERFENIEPTSAKIGSSIESPRLALIGALEESILAIEKVTLHEGENRQRDVGLGHLYSSYGFSLSELSPHECRLLALDPHTLLIGADTVQADPSKPPSTHLCTDNAENSLRNAVTLDATNQIAQKRLEGILGDNGSDANAVHTRKPKEFVAELFDSFAVTFDEKLLKGLQYKVPKLMGDVVQSLRPSYSNGLDAGCGTGLAGRFLRQLVSNTMLGVDASQKMLDIAAKCTMDLGCGLEALDPGNMRPAAVPEGSDKDAALYDGLLLMDLESMTVANTLHQVAPETRVAGFDLIVAADVLVYFGSLENLLKTFAEVSILGASLVFSCERTTEEEAPLGWRLLPSGRFAHTKLHVEDVAKKAGYALKVYKEIVPRMEKGAEVQGHLFAYELNMKGSTQSEL